MNKQNKQLDQPESRRLSSASTQPADPTSINIPPTQQPADKQLNGIAGWLAFFMVVLALGGLLFTGIFFDELVKIRYTPHTPLQFYLYFDLPAHSFLSCLTDILPAQISGSVITSPVVATLAITAVIAISQRKKLGKRLAIAAYISCLVNHFPMVDNVRYDVEEMPTVIINAIISVVIPATIIGLLCLYFCVSKRVKETLTE